MDPRELKESSSQVFLTEAHTSIHVPVPFTQHSLDSNPHFIISLQKQQKEVAALHATGTEHSPRRIEKVVEAVTRRMVSLEEERRREEGERQQEGKQNNEVEITSLLLEDLKSRQIRTWTKMTAKITFPEPSEDYYSRMPIKPGIWFWRALLIAKTARPLLVRIPDMLAVFEEVRWAYFDEERDRVEVKSEFGIGSVYKSFERFRDGLNPCAVIRIPGQSVTEMKAVLLNWYDFGEKVVKSQLPGTCLIQRLLKCHGSRPTIIRLFYVAQSRLNKASYAYSISNTDTAMKKYTNGKTLVCSEYYDGIEITPQYGSALISVRSAGQKVVEFLQAVYFLRFEEIVLDFVRDEHNEVWLLSCKGFKIDLAVQHIREIRQSEEQGKSAAEIKALHMQKLDEQLSAIHCKLCLLPYKPFEMQHMIPFKVLLLYKQHTYRSERKLLDLSHLRVNTVDFLSHCVSVCEICYMLLVHEYELIETEMRLAALLNVPVKHPQVMGAFQYEHPNFMPAVMHQWRLMFYFQLIESQHPDIIQGPLYLQYSFLGASYIYKMSPKWTNESQAVLNVSRLYYFFAVRDSGVVKFCESTVMQFRITRSRKWEDVVATGECRPLSLFTTLLPACSSLMQSFDILFFQCDCCISKIRLKLGFACDKQLQVKTLPVKITRFATLYVPEPSFFTSDSLPDSWMEAFQQDYIGLEESRIIGSSEELDEMYTPVLPKHYIQSHEVYQKPKNRPMNRTQSAHAFNSIVPLLPIPAFGKTLEAGSKRTRNRGSDSTSASSRVLYHTESITKLRSPTLISARTSDPRACKWEGNEGSPCVDSFEDEDDADREKNAGQDVAEIVNLFMEKRIGKKGDRAMSVPKECELSGKAASPRPIIRPFSRPASKRIRLKRASARRSLTALSPYQTLLPGAAMRSARAGRL